MKPKLLSLSVFVLIASLLLAACGNSSALLTSAGAARAAATPAATLTQPTAVASAPALPQTVPSGAATSLSAYQAALESIYEKVNPSVVSIRVVEGQTISSGSFAMPGQDSGPQPFSQGLGSGFVWNQDGYIVTNNHVTSGATKIEVTFSDGTAVPAKLVGADPDSDLAVVKVNDPGIPLTPITISEPGSVKVGQVAVAIGNPYGLENSMTVGIVSAMGRTIAASRANSLDGLNYSIPDIIQTDTAINPGNSGGPLVNDQGALIGVNAAIESYSNANSGVGFAIPASLVSRVVPELIQNGKFEHTYIGISGTSLTPDLAAAMKLETSQRGALVEEVTSGGPAEKAGLRGSAETVTIDGRDIPVGGDVITAINDAPVKTMDDIISYLANNTSVGQQVTLTVLREGKQTQVNVTLAARPADTVTEQASTNSSTDAQGAWLGVSAQTMTPEIAAQMDLSADQAGVLVQQVTAGSPADEAGLQGSYKPVQINGQRVLVGGDVITAIDGQAIPTTDELKAALAAADPGQKVELTILRNGQQQTLTAALVARP